MIRSTSCLVVLVVLLGMGQVLAEPITPGVLIRHSGATNPTTEGWTFRNPRGFSVGPILGDEGFDAWVLDDDGNGELEYNLSLSDAQVAEALSRGWRLTARLKVAEVPDPVDNGINLAFNSGAEEFSVDFGSSSDAHPIVRLGGEGHTPVILGGLDGGYHLYEMQYNPTTSVVTLSVDGVPTLTEDRWNTSPVQKVRFDSGFRGTGEGRWNLVEFEIIPEPSTLLLLGMGAVGLLVYAARRRRRS